MGTEEHRTTDKTAADPPFGMRDSESTGSDFEQFFSLSLELMCVAGTDTRLRRINPAFERVLGYSTEELVGKSFLQFVHPDDRESTMQEIARLESGKDTIHFENRCCRRDGSWRWLAWTCPAPQGESGLLYGMARDITLQKQASEAIRIRDSAFSSMQQGLLITDPNLPDNPVIYSNPAFTSMTGYLFKEIEGRNCRFLQGSDRDQAPIATLRQAVSDGQPCRVVLRNYRRNGEMFWNELTLSPVRDDKGQLTHFVGMQHEITELVSTYRDRWRGLSKKIDTLPQRQREVMDRLVIGRSVKQIALELALSPKTIEMHRTRLLKSLDVADVAELVRLVITHTPPDHYS